MKKICIVGGGASGLMAALAALKSGGRVTIFEKNSEVGSKILRTGNGKCNFTNLDLNETFYKADDPSFVKQAIDRFSNEDLVMFLTRLGLLIKEKSGWLYPFNEQAKAVRNVLLAEAVSYGVDIRTDSCVNMIVKENDKFLVSVSGLKEREAFDKVIIATGGVSGLVGKEKFNGFDLTDGFNIKREKALPGLVKLKCEGLDFKNLKGSRCDCNITLFVEDEPAREEAGELIFWDEGISGICVFSLSNHCAKALENNKEIVVKLDFLPDFDEENLASLIKAMCLVNIDKTVEEFFAGMLNDKLVREICLTSDINLTDKVGSVGADNILSVSHKFKNVYLVVKGTADFTDAQIMLGGIRTDELTNDFESKNVPGLYIIGEMTDVSGPCGGYNLQWAFTSGSIAGENACYS